MKNWKKHLSLFLCIMMCLSIIPTSVQAEEMELQTSELNELIVAEELPVEEEQMIAQSEVLDITLDQNDKNVQIFETVIIGLEDESPLEANDYEETEFLHNQEKLDVNEIITEADENGVNDIDVWELKADETPVSTLDLNPRSISINASKTADLQLHATPYDATIESVTWSSDDPTIATVSAVENYIMYGIVVGVSVGTTTINAKVVSCGKTYDRKCTVKVGFSDVEKANYFYKPVYWAYNKGITSGTSPSSFSPGNICTRGQILTFLWKSMDSPKPSSTDNPFTDVKPSDYFYKPVLWAKENGITSGTSPTTFSPHKACTRGQIVTFLWILAGRPGPYFSSPFSDVKITDYYFEPAVWAKNTGITSGTSATTFSPGNPCTRAQALTFLWKMKENPWQPGWEF